MKKKLFTLFSFIFLSTSSFVFASTEVQEKEFDTYTQCKKEALSRKEKTMHKAYELYRASSTDITLKTREKIDTIKWQIYSSYYIAMRKTIADQKEAMIPVDERIAKTRALALSTWKAEDALCDFMHAKETKRKSK